jgi:hypothetical protein
MALSRASLIALETAVTAEATATDKTTVLMAGLINAVVADVTLVGVLTPGQQNHAAAVAAEVAANIADFVTALEVA